MDTQKEGDEESRERLQSFTQKRQLLMGTEINNRKKKREKEKMRRGIV
jgi:hypothetical protein